MSINSFINPEFLEKQATHLEEGFLIGWIPGIITSIDDLEKMGRVKCSIPLFNESENIPNSEDSMVWVLEDYTVPDSLGGSHRKLEVGSQVALLPLMGNPTQFILIGCIPNRKDRPHPLLNRQKGTHGEVTPNGVQDIKFDDKNTRYVGYPNGLTYQISERGDWQLETLEGATYVAREDGNLLIDNRQGSMSITPRGDVEQSNKSGVTSLLDKDGNYLVDTPFKSKISLTQDETEVEAPNSTLGGILNLIEKNVRSKISKVQDKIPQLLDLAQSSIGDFLNQEQNLANIDEIVNDITNVVNGFDEGVKAIDDLVNYPDEELVLDFDRAIHNIQQKGISDFSSQVKEELSQESINKENIFDLLSNSNSNPEEINDLIDGLEYDRDLLEDAILRKGLGDEYNKTRPISKFGVLDSIEYLQELYKYLVDLKERIIKLKEEIKSLESENENQEEDNDQESEEDNSEIENDNDIFSRSPLKDLQDKIFRKQKKIKDLKEEINRLEEISNQNYIKPKINTKQKSQGSELKIKELKRKEKEISDKNIETLKNLEDKIKSLKDTKIIKNTKIVEINNQIIKVKEDYNSEISNLQEEIENLRTNTNRETSLTFDENQGILTINNGNNDNVSDILSQIEGLEERIEEIELTRDSQIQQLEENIKQIEVLITKNNEEINRLENRIKEIDKENSKKIEEIDEEINKLNEITEGSNLQFNEETNVLDLDSQNEESISSEVSNLQFNEETNILTLNSQNEESISSEGSNLQFNEETNILTLNSQNKESISSEGSTKFENPNSQKIDEIKQKINKIKDQNNKKIKRLERRIRDLNTSSNNSSLSFDENQGILTINNQNNSNSSEKIKELRERIKTLRPENNKEIKDLKIEIELLESKGINTPTLTENSEGLTENSEGLTENEFNKLKLEAKEKIEILKQKILELEEEIDNLNKVTPNSNQISIDTSLQSSLNQNINFNESRSLGREQRLANQQKIERLEKRIEKLEEEVKRTVIAIQLEYPPKFRKHISLFYLESLWEFPNPVSRSLNRLQKRESLELKEIILNVKEYVNELPKLKNTTSGLREKNLNKIYHNSRTQNQKFEPLKQATEEAGETSISEVSFGKVLGDYNPSKISLDKFNPQVFIDSNKTPLGNIDLSNLTNQKVKNIEIESLLKGIDLQDINLSELSNINLNELDLDNLPLKEIFGSKQVKDFVDLPIKDLNLKNLVGDINLGQLAMGNFAGALNLDEILLDDLLGIDLGSMPLGGILSSISGGIDIGNLDIGSLIGGIDLGNLDLGNLDLGLGKNISNIADNAVGAIGGIAKGIGGLFGGGKDKADEVLGFFNPNPENTILKLERQKSSIKTPFGSELNIEDGKGEFNIIGGSRLTLNRSFGELSSLTGSAKAFVSEGSASLFSPTGILSTGGLSSLGGIAMSALGSGGIATGLSIAKTGLMTLGSFKSNKNVEDPTTVDLSKDSYEIDQENPLSGIGIGQDFVDINEQDSKLHIGSGNYELKVGKNSSTQKITESFQDFRSGDSYFKLISGEGVNYDVEGVNILTPKFMVNDKDWLFWIEYIIKFFEGVFEHDSILMWSGNEFKEGGLNNLKDITLETEILDKNSFLKWNKESEQWENQPLNFEDINYTNKLNEEEQGVFIKTVEGWELQPLSFLRESSQNILGDLLNSENLPTENRVITWNPELNKWEAIKFEDLQETINIQNELSNSLGDISENSFVYFNGENWISFSLEELRSQLGVSNSLSEATNNPNGIILTYSNETESWEWKTEEWLSSFVKNKITQESLIPNGEQGKGLIYSDAMELEGKYIPNFDELTESGIVTLEQEEWVIVPFNEILTPQIEAYFNNVESPNSTLSLWVKENGVSKFISQESLASTLINRLLPTGINQGDGLGWDTSLQEWTIVQTLNSLKNESPLDKSLITWDNLNNKWDILDRVDLIEEITGNLSINDLFNVSFIDVTKDSLLIWNKNIQSWEGRNINQFELSLENIKEVNFNSNSNIDNNSLLYWDQFRSKWVVGFPDFKIDDLYKVNLEPERNRDNIVIEWDKKLKHWRSRKSIRRLLDIEDVLDLENEVKNDSVLKWSEEYGQWIPSSIETLGVNLLSELLDTDVESFENIPEDDEILTWDETNQIWKPTAKRKLIEDLDNVSSNTPGDRFVLEWDSSNNEWTPVNPDDLNISSQIERLSDIGDISLSGDNLPSDGQVLTFDAFNLQWIPTNAGGPETTDDLQEGSLNKYYTNSRVDTRLGEVSITSLADVNTTSVSPLSGNVLAWNSVESEWKPENINNLSFSLNNLSNIDLSNLENNHVLVYNINTNQWETTDFGNFNIANRSITELNDVESNPFLEIGQVLMWNGNQWGVSSLDLNITNLNQISNVDTSVISSAEGQILRWNEFNNSWVRSEFPTVSESIELLSDTYLSNVSPQTGQFLIWNNSSNVWERSVTTLEDLTNNTLSDLDDVDSNLTTPSNNHILKWDNSNTRWIRGFVSINDIEGIDTSGDTTENLLLIWDNFNQVWKRDSLLIQIDSLGDITNVETTNISPSTTQYLGWNNTNNRWERKEFPFIPSEIDNLNNVNTQNETPSNSQILIWNETSQLWVRSSGDINSLISLQMGQLNDVVTDNITSEDKQLLIWSNTSSQWQRSNLSLSIEELNNVTINSLSDNDILSWDSFTFTWIPKNLTIGTSELEDFNYDIANLTTGDILKWNGSNWVSSSDLGAISDLNDTNVNSPSAGQLLKWDEISNQWFNSYLLSLNEIDEITIDYNNISNEDILTYNNGLSQWEAKSLSEILTSIDYLNDVDTSTSPPAINNVLAWDGSNWIPSSVSVDITSLDSLGDVDLTTNPPSVDNVLKWDGSNWIPGGVSVNVTSIDSLGDVDTSSNPLEDNQVLTWDNSNGIWVPKIIEITSLGEINNVDLTTTPPQNEDILIWDSANSKWKPSPITLSSINIIEDVEINTASLNNNSILKWDVNQNKWINQDLVLNLDYLSQISNVDTTTNGKNENYVIVWETSSQKWVSKEIPFNYSSINLYQDVDTDLKSDQDVLTWIDAEGAWKPKALQIPLTDLTDVDISDPILNGKLIVWNETTAKWEESVLTIEELTINTLGSIPNVELTNLIDKQFLVWDEVSSTWVNQTFSFNIEDINNVDATTKQDGDVLVWSDNLSKWEVRPLNLASVEIGDLGNVNTTIISPDNQQLLLWNNSSSEWQRSNLDQLNLELDSLTNVDTTVNTSQDQQLLVWSETESKWIRSNQTLSTLEINSLDDVGDVDTTSIPPINQSLLAWNNTANNWQPISVTNLLPSLDVFPDVDLSTSPTQDQILRWDSLSSKWIPSDPGLSITSSDDVPEGNSNFYFTQPRLVAFLETLSIGNFIDVNLTNQTPAEGSILSWSVTENSWIITANSLVSESSLLDLGDVEDIGSINDQSILIWNSQEAQWKTNPFNLHYLNDVDIQLSNPSDGAIITWDDTQGMWVEGVGISSTDDIPEGTTNKYFTSSNLNISLENSNLSIIGDVTYTDINNNTYTKNQNNALIWDTNLSKWRPSGFPLPETTDQLEEGTVNFWFTETRTLNTIRTLGLYELNDVNYGIPEDGQVLAWDAVNEEWNPQQSVSPNSTDDIPEGTSNLYFKNSYVSNFLSSASIQLFADISFTNLSDNDVLVWNSTENYWENKSNSVFTSELLSGNTLNVFGDVNYSSPTEDSVLVWNSTENYWENKSNSVFTSELLSGNTLNVFEDVNYSNPQDGQVLLWDSSSGNFIAGSPSNISLLSDDITEGNQNLFFTVDRVNNVIDVTSITQLSDVSQNSPTSSNVLLWDNSLLEWKPNEFSLSNLIDTDDAAKETNSLLFWNNGTSKWQDFVLTFNFLPEVSISNPQDDDSLVWDANVNQWVAKRPTSRINLSGLSRADKTSNLNIQAETIYVDGENSLYLEDLGNNEAKLTYDLELPITERGDLLIHNGQEYSRLLLGEEQQVLTVDRSVFSGLRWDNPRTPLQRLGNIAANYTLTSSDHSFIYRIIDSVLITLPINEDVSIGFKCTFKIDADNITLQFSSFGQIRGNNRTFTIRDNYITVIYEGLINQVETWSLYVEGFNYLDLELFSDLDLSNPSNKDVLTYDTNTGKWIASESQSKLLIEGKQFSNTSLDISGVSSKLILEDDLYIKDINTSGEARIGNKISLPLTTINSILTFDGNNLIEQTTVEEDALLVTTSTGLSWVKNYKTFLDYKEITSASYTILEADHGKILKIINECEITLPSIIKEGFYVDIRKESSDNSITIIGNLLNEVPDLTIQYESLTLLFDNGNWLSEYNGGVSGGDNGGGGGLSVSNTKTTDFIANPNTSNPCDTSMRQVICTLPESQEVIKIQCFDSVGVNPENNLFPNGFSKHSLIIQPNTGQTIQGSTNSLFLDNENSSVTLTYNPSSKRWSISDGIFFNDINIVSNTTNNPSDFTEYDKNILNYSPFVYLPFKYLGKEPNLINYGSKEDFLIFKNNKERLKFNGSELTIKVTETTGASLENDHYLYRNISISPTFSVSFKLRLTKDTNINEYIRFLWLFGNEFSIDASHNLVSSDGTENNFSVSDSDSFSTWTSIVYNISQDSQSDLFLNGRYKGTQDQMRFSVNENDLVKIGLLGTGIDEKFNGIKIKDFIIFNRQLNEEERILLADE